MLLSLPILPIKLTNSPKLKVRDDYFAAIHLLKLFIHFELGNFDHLIYELKNVRELLKRKEYLFEFEKQAIGLLKKFLKNCQAKSKTGMLLKNLIYCIG